MKATPKRYRTAEGVNVGGWAYRDEEQTRFAFICSAEGFGLPSFDDFIDSLPAKSDYRRELLNWRDRAFSAFRSGDRSALRGWLQAAWTSWKADITFDAIQPDLKRGAKSVSAGKAGHTAVHGTEDEKQQRWKEYQNFIDRKHAENPSLSYTACADKAAKNFGVSVKTITRHTKNWK